MQIETTKPSDPGPRGTTDDMPWVVVRAGAGRYALSTRHVHEMVSTPAVTVVPHASEFVRGIINLRGQVMPLVDLRLRFGLSSQAHALAELGELLRAREDDHRRWVRELVACVEERRPFTLTTDPHACAFGKWYDTFKTDNVLLDMILKRFDAPHRRIHAIGQSIVDGMARGDFDACAALVSDGRSTLEALVKLFDEARTELTDNSREIAVVLRGAGPTCAIAVDGIESVERLPREAMSRIDDSDASARNEFVESIAQRARDGSLVLTLRADRLLG